MNLVVGLHVVVILQMNLYEVIGFPIGNPEHIEKNVRYVTFGSVKMF